MKTKNLILMLVIALAVVLFPGVVAAAPSASNWQLYCGDVSDTVSKEEPVYCYLIAEITNEGNVGIYGALTGIEVEQLTIEGYGPADTTTIDFLHYDYEATSDKSSRVCSQKAGCIDFTAKNPTTGILSRAGQNVGTQDGISKINESMSGYTIIGWWQVKLADDATADNCGKICVYIDPVMTMADLTATPRPTLDDPSTSNGRCREIKPKIEIKKTCYTEGEGENIKYYGKDGNPTTKEQYEKDCIPPTGGWASYAVLAAGAFIALSAITIAKKHNKFYQV
jgi:hypothetical protein